jgi:hypothetical protein
MLNFCRQLQMIYDFLCTTQKGLLNCSELNIMRSIMLDHYFLTKTNVASDIIHSFYPSVQFLIANYVSCQCIVPECYQYSRMKIVYTPFCSRSSQNSLYGFLLYIRVNTFLNAKLIFIIHILLITKIFWPDLTIIKCSSSLTIIVAILTS